MYKLLYFEQAKKDLIQIKRYITKESGSSGLARKYTDRLREQCRKLAELPGTIGRARPELAQGVCSILYGSYVIFFRYNNDFVEIIIIIEGHRDIEELFQQ